MTSSLVTAARLTVGAALSNTKLSAVPRALTLPAGSVALPRTEKLPAVVRALSSVALQLPSWSATTVAKAVVLLPRYSATVLPGSAVPLNEGRVLRVTRSVLLLPLSVSADMRSTTGGKGATVSTVKIWVRRTPRLPALSSTCRLRLCWPSARVRLLSL